MRQGTPSLLGIDQGGATIEPGSKQLFYLVSRVVLRNDRMTANVYRYLMMYQLHVFAIIVFVNSVFPFTFTSLKEYRILEASLNSFRCKPRISLAKASLKPHISLILAPL